MAIKIEISSIDDLIAFVNIIRCKNINLEDIKKMTIDLNKGADALQHAIDEGATNQRVQKEK